MHPSPAQTIADVRLFFVRKKLVLRFPRVFFTVNIRNANTRAAYGRAEAADICACEIVESANRARSTGASASVGAGV